MKKLQKIALCALVTPIMSLGATSVLAQQSTDKDMDRKQYSSQRAQDSRQSGSVVTDAQSTKRAMANRGDKAGQYRNETRGYLASTPATGMHASALIGTEVKTHQDDDVGSVSDLVINEDGQVIALVIGVGGVLGMGEKTIAIGWDDVTQSTDADKPDELDLRIDASKEDLRSAPEFNTSE